MRHTYVDSCFHLISDCGDPDIPYGRLSADSVTVYEGTATVECENGYQGGGTATCLSDGNWDTLPTCEPIGCFFG